MNIVVTTGRLTHDPELRQTPNGTPVLSFSIAVQRDYKNEDGTYSADFFNCVAWRGTAENIARFFRKGDFIEINGSLQSRTYKDKDSGKNRTAVEILVDRFSFGGVKKEGSPKEAELPEGFAEIDSDAGDLPFEN